MLDRDALASAYDLGDRSVPRVRMNFVASLDGAATVAGRSGPLGDADDQQVMGVLRELSDIVMVGAGTVRIEGYGGVRPRLAIVSSALDLDAGMPVFGEASTPPIVITHGAAPATRVRELERVAEVLMVGERSVDLPAALAALAARGLTQVLCEGGPHLFGALATADAVDELCLSLSALIVGGDGGRILRGAPQLKRPMRLISSIRTDEMLFLRYAASSSA